MRLNKQDGADAKQSWFTNNEVAADERRRSASRVSPRRSGVGAPGNLRVHRQAAH